MRYLFTIFLLVATFIIYAQPTYQAIDLETTDFSVNYSSNYTTTDIHLIPLTKIDPFLAFSMSWVNANHIGHLHPEIRFSKDGLYFDDWQQVPLAHHQNNHLSKQTSDLLLVDKENRFYQVRFPIAKNWLVQNIKLYFYNPQKTPSSPSSTSFNSGAKSSCPCPIPSFQNRNNWCPTGNCPPSSSPVSTVPTHIIVHHSAGTNVSNDWAAVVRSIWSLHVNTNGWSDIGYNWLIDPNGVIYEGRGDNILGAHFCGTNGQTVGICVMGNYDLVTPSTFSLNSLTQFLAWKTCDLNISPTGSALHTSSGTTLDRISGHQQGCATACPGSQLFPLLPNIRTSVDSFIQNNCSFGGNAIDAPTLLSGTTQSSSSVLLQWTDNSNNEDSFLIERSIFLATNFQYIASVGANITSFTDTGLNAQTGYFYRVRAANSTDTSAYSNEAFIGTSPVSTELLTFKNSLTIYPNPVKDVIHIQLNNSYQGQLHFALKNIHGQLIQEQTIEKPMENWTFDWQLRNLPSGVYLLSVASEVGLVSFRVLRE